MTDHNPHDWLSALLDGEMTADERAAAERLLQGDPGSERELQQFREIGDLLRTLPSHEPPAGFSNVVMRRCEQESLLEGVPIGNVADAADVGSEAGTWQKLPASVPSTEAGSFRHVAGSRRTRSTLAIVAGILATAAMLFLLVQVVSPPGTPTPERAKSSGLFAENDLARTDADKDRAVPVKAAPEKVAERLPSSAAATSTTAKTLPRDLSKSAGLSVTQSFAKRGLEIPQNGGQNRPAPGPIRFGAGGRGGFGGAGGGSMRFEMDDRESRFRIGEVVPYLQVAGDRTAVIEVTVVDVNSSVGRLEVLLKRKLVMPLTKKLRQPLPAKVSAESKLLSLKKADDAKPKSELIAVYVESTQAQLAEVMRELDRETQSLHVSLRPPVALGDVRLMADSDSWADLFRRDRRRSPQTLADAADFGRQAVVTRSGNAAGGSRTGRSAPRLTRRAGGVPKDEAEKGKRRGKDGTRSADKKNVNSNKDVGNRRKWQSAQKEGRKPADPAANSIAGAATAARSFQLRLKLSEQPTVPEERDAKGQKGRPSPRTDPRRMPMRQVREYARFRGTAVTRPVQVIFVFRATSAPDQPVPARRPK
jgi:negative regulator of sigma E activity